MQSFLKSPARRKLLLGGVAVGAVALFSRFFGAGLIRKVNAKPVPSKARLGVNMAGLSDWSTEQPFVDFFKQSREWISQSQNGDWGRGPTLDIDINGWVTSLPEKSFATRIIASAENGQYPSGEYIVLYEGEGKLTVNETMGEVIESKPGRMVVKVDANKGLFWLNLVDTNPDNYVRNIRVLQPAFEQSYLSNPWQPDFLKRWQGVACVRMMDWMGTNHSTIEKWDDKPNVDDASYANKGVPLELLIDLANRLKTDLWLCMPHQSDDAYNQNTAQLVKETLDPNQKVWLEYSNEVWNTLFSQSMYAIKQGRKLGFSGEPIRVGGKYAAHRSAEIFKLWRAVFGESHTRVVNVLSGFSNMPYLAEVMLEVDAAAELANVFAIAPYIGLNVSTREQNGISDKIIANWSLDRLFAHVSNYSLPEANKTVDTHLKITQEYALKLVAYESGQHLVGIKGAENNQKLTDLFVKANADERMKDIYSNNLAHWENAGGDLICSFNSMEQWAKYGSWGLLQNRSEDPKKSAKFSAVIEWAKAQGQPMDY